MYIAVGSSKKYSLNEGNRNGEEDSNEATDLDLSTAAAEPFVVLKRSPDGKYFVTATSDVLFLWSSKPTVVVSKIHRSREHVDAEGKNAVVTWRPDSTALAVKTSKSFIHVYELSINEAKEVFNFNFTDNDRVHVLQGPGQARGLRSAELNFKFSVEVEDGVSCLTGLKSDLLVATFQNHRMLSISWAGEIEDCRYDFSFLQEILEPKKVFISEVVYSTRMDLFAFILSDKSIFLSFTKDVSFDVETKNHVLLSPNPQRKAIHFYCADKNDTRTEKTSPCTVAVESRFRLIAIGTEEGDVWVYHLNREMQLFLSHKLRCPWADVSPVQSLSWTSDGHAIAVGWMKNGFSVFTSFGRHLVSCKSEDDEMDSRNRESEAYLNGISSLFWTRGHYGLMINPSSDAVSGPTLFCVPFAKYAVSTCNIRDNMRNPFLIADDRLLIHSGTDVDSSPLSPLSMVWQVVQFPPSYISDNWPIRYAASSADGRKIAIAGEYGFALCNMSSGGGKWKLFGSRQHERSFSVLGGVLFHKDLIIVGAEDKLSFKNELRVYSTERNLDNSSIMFKETFRSRIIFMNILYNKLLVYTIHNDLHQYSISRGRNELRIIKENVFDLKDSIYSPFSVQYIDCYLPMAAETEITEKTSILVLQEGHLEIVDYKGKSINLADHIEFCWAYFPRRPVGDLFNVLWAFDGECSKVWINLLLKKSRTFFLTHAATLSPLKLSLDFYPLSVLFHKGVVVGVDQYLSRMNSLDTACFKSVGKTFLFLPDLVSYLLQRGFFIEAVRYSAYYQEYDYFGHSMEILVHKILDREALRFHKIPHNERFLPIVVQFLRNFPHFHDVIVRCARKTEVAMWDYLFEIVGDPKELFNFCLQEGYLRTATSFLVIIQTLEPSAISGKLQMDLLEKCLEAEEFDLVSEIVRYLTSVSSSANASRPQALNTGTLLAISADEEQTFFIDILISRHIRKLMSGLRVRTAGKLAATLNFPLVEWLHKERYRSCYIKNLKLAFKELHHQFEWPFPSEDNVKHYMSKNKKDVESIVDEDFNAEFKGADLSAKNDMTTRRASFDSQSYRRASFSDDTIDFPKHKAPSATKQSGFMRRHSERGDLERELRNLVDVMISAHCYQWALLMSTLVFDLGTAATILRESSKDKEFETLYGDYKSMLQNCGSPEYAKFAASLSELLNLQ